MLCKQWPVGLAGIIRTTDGQMQIHMDFHYKLFPKPLLKLRKQYSVLLINNGLGNKNFPPNPNGLHIGCVPSPAETFMVCQQLIFNTDRSMC